MRWFPWVFAVTSLVGLVEGLTAGRTGFAVVTYTITSMFTGALPAPFLAALLALLPWPRHRDLAAD